MITEPTALPVLNDVAADQAPPGLPPQIQKHLGALLAGVYEQEVVEPEATDPFVDLLARLDLALGRAEDRADAEFRRLLVTVTSALRRFALSLTHDPVAADDLVQNTCLRAWKNRGRFEPGTNFEAWTFTILRNQFYSDRRRSREVQDEEGGYAARLISLPDQAGHLDLQDVQLALAQLPPHMREALMLVTVENLSYEEAAAIMGCQLGTAKSRVSRARSHLVQMLGFTGDELGNDAIMLSAMGRPAEVES
ncbi:sigma-70 family RNA polymerase sigma factor [Methylobacterium sp. J-076]|uniref:sigma-70 family RNA polymerase sigma factor n=1 Tax=Methylobacterium sp. J-076 TaxID=2836655 RepID=UPI001FBAA541|nr:sigma-70 family RNA polymerase sigma factor [Methylobacterium sp. J-076]MCJ2012656.1 sigma-70 family RNA polymerase sigma factor [Methylobacterium sp. J-076]